MDEILELQRQLEEVQRQVIKHKLNERNCVEIVSHLISIGKVDVVSTYSGDYLTFDALQQEVLDEVAASGGRTNLHDLQSILNIDINHIDRAVRKLAVAQTSPASANPIRMIGGEIMTDQYLDGLTRGALRSHLEEVCSSTVGSLAVRFGLPMELMGEMLKRGMQDGVLSITMKKNVVLSKAYEKTIRCRIRGLCSACSRSVSVNQLIKLLAIECEEAEILDAIAGMIRAGELHGSLKGRMYIPAVYLEVQRASLEDFYKRNGYIEFSRVRKFNVSKPAAYISELYPDAIVLSTCAINKGYVSELVGSLDELHNHWNESTSQHLETRPTSSPFIFAPDLLASSLPREDVTQLLSLLLAHGLNIENISIGIGGREGGTLKGGNQKTQLANTKGKSSSVKAKDKDKDQKLLVVSEVFVIPRPLLSWLKKWFAEDARRVTRAIAEIVRPSYGAMSIMMDATDETADREQLAQVILRKTREIMQYSSNAGLFSVLATSESAGEVRYADFTTDNSISANAVISQGSIAEEKIELPFEQKVSDLDEILPEIRSLWSRISSRARLHATFCDLDDVDLSELMAPCFSAARASSLLRQVMLAPHSDCGSGEGSSEFKQQPSDAELEEFLRDIWELIRSSCVSNYLCEAKGAFTNVTQGSCDDGGLTLRLEEERNKAFFSMWTDLQVVARGLGHLEGRKLDSYRPTKSPGPQRIMELHAHTICQRCAPIAALLTMHASWASSGPPITSFGAVPDPVYRRCGYALSNGDKQHLKKYFSREMSSMLLRLWELCGADDDDKHHLQSTVWDFMDFLVSTVGPSLSLSSGQASRASSSMWTLDKKRERLAQSSIRQSLIEALQAARREFHATKETRDSKDPTMKIPLCAIFKLGFIMLSTSDYQLLDRKAIYGGAVYIDIPTNVSDLMTVSSRILEDASAHYGDIDFIRHLTLLHEIIGRLYRSSNDLIGDVESSSNYTEEDMFLIESMLSFLLNRAASIATRK